MKRNDIALARITERRHEKYPKDWSKSNDGGDYHEYEYVVEFVFIDENGEEKKVKDVFYYSSYGGAFCEVSGNYCSRTNYVPVRVRYKNKIMNAYFIKVDENGKEIKTEFGVHANAHWYDYEDGYVVEVQD